MLLNEKTFPIDEKRENRSEMIIEEVMLTQV